MTLPKLMTAIAIESAAKGNILVPGEIPVPAPGPGQILIKVKSAGVNRADLLQVMGNHPPPAGAPATPGLEAAGTVAELGRGVSGWKVGDQICALLPGGGYAEYALAPEPCCLPLPKGVSLVDAGGIPEVYFTVWSNVFDRAHLVPGETLLVCEMVPALFAAVAANEAEKVAPENTRVDVQMIGAAGRLYISGRNSGIHRAKDRIAAALEAIESRAQ